MMIQISGAEVHLGVLLMKLKSIVKVSILIVSAWMACIVASAQQSQADGMNGGSDDPSNSRQTSQTRLSQSGTQQLLVAPADVIIDVLQSDQAVMEEVKNLAAE